MLLRTRLARLGYSSPLARPVLSSKPIFRALSTPPQSQSQPAPWFVDEDEPSTLPTRFTQHNENTTLPASAPPPTEAPAPLHTLHSHLTSLPLLQSVTVLTAAQFQELRASGESTQPSRRPHGKRRRGGSSFGGTGVGDPPALWEWVLQAEVKPGAEKRGAVTSVMRSALKAVRPYFIQAV
ncbi:hypothetical protein DL93DRAFT_2083115 [Clavulina sp. PMI_390]|nr:hypothetical protein DL93DRAFT_2083115 [Clavulina sp. PMI_390]